MEIKTTSKEQLVVWGNSVIVIDVDLQLRLMLQRVNGWNLDEMFQYSKGLAKSKTN